MAFGVFIHRSDSIYDDSPAERYQFPSQYLSGVQACVSDRGLISLSDNLEILVSRQVNDPDGVHGIINKTGLAFAPRRPSNRPHPHFLQWHREHRFKH